MPDNGFVTLVGAGPGDPGLLTLAGKSAIENADVILYDRLVGDCVLSMMPSRALKIDVGKCKGSHPVPQPEINRLIVRYAQEGKHVVRLKGGDPYLFGRGAEELEPVAKAGIPFRVIPGVTSAIAAPARAGIPVTHREYSSSVHILTGHGKDGAAPDIPYDALAKLNGTLVFLMSVSTAGEICANLIAAGLPPDTPAALVENGTRDNQRRLSATLRTLPEQAAAGSFSSPAVLVVGSVAGLADSLDETVRLPLRGRRILAVSSATTGGRLAGLLHERGCIVDEFAGIVMERLPVPDSLWRETGGYDWIVFSSQFGVDCFFAGLFEAGLDIRAVAKARFAVVGGQTGQALSRHGIRPDYTPEEFNGRSLGEGLSRLVGPQARLLLFRAESGNEDLPDALRGHGISFTEVAAYRTNKQTPGPLVTDRLRTGFYDALTFTSASSVEAFVGAIPAGCPLPPVFCIGKTTAKAAEKAGMNVTTSREATLDSMAEAVTEKMGTA